MILTFIAPSNRYPSGGVAVVFEFACSMAKRGHVVHLCHTPFMLANVSGMDDLDWFSFSGEVIHHFPTPEELAGPVPSADFIFGFDADEEKPAHTGLPVVLIQGYEMLSPETERRAFQAPCPKVCVAEWLVEIGRGFGVPDAQLVHIPIGLRHEKYRLSRPISNRPPRVSFCYSSHSKKNAALAFDVLVAVKRVVPELEATVFGALPPSHDRPEWVTQLTDPSQTELVDDIYNASRVFLCTSDVEGFGLTNIEAMSCGAALVTTDNGGSREYAHHDLTALVAPTGDVQALADHVVSLLLDDDRCTRIATAGREHVKRFDWDRSAARLESFLEAYRADPGAYGQPRGSVPPVRG